MSGIDLLPAAASGVPATLLDAKGDLIAASAADTAARLAVGTNGHVLTADSAQATGVKWAAAAGGGIAMKFVAGRYYGPQSPGTADNTLIGDGGLNSLVAMPFWVGEEQAFDRILTGIHTAAASALVRLGIYASTADGMPGALVVDAGTVDASATGIKEAVIAQTLAPGLYWPCMVAQVAGARVWYAITVGVREVAPTTITDFTSYAAYQQTGVSGALPANFTAAPSTRGENYWMKLRAA